FRSLAPFGVALFVGDRRRLLGLPELIERLIEILGHIEIVLEQKLDGAFPRFASHAHRSIFWDIMIDLIGPGADAALDALEILKALFAQETQRFHRANPALAMDIN